MSTSFYCGTLEEAIEKLVPEREMCPCCGWPDIGEAIWDRLPMMDCDGIDYSGLHVYHQDYHPCYDPDNDIYSGYGYIVIQCQRCLSFFKYDVST